MNLIDEKRILRGTMLAWRGSLGEDERRAAAHGLLEMWRLERPVQTPAVVSGFWPMAEELDIQAAKMGRKISVLLQVNASEEESKHGVAVGASVHLAEQMDSMPNLQFIGLMTMAPLEAPEAKVRQSFSRTREIFEELKWHKIGGSALRHLSMGMSHDFELAIAEGATMVRVGSLLFGGKFRDHEMEDEG